jgi:hypothetical protein
VGVSSQGSSQPKGNIMNILFNASGCGLGNNGGTKTIIRSAETLIGMGQVVKIYANVNKYTWDTTFDSAVITNNTNDQYFTQYGMPHVCVVCVSVWDVENTINYFKGEKFWWMRGWERWVRGEPWLISQIKKIVNNGGKIIVNSPWLIKQLKEKCNVDAKLCYAGLDLDIWEDRNNIRKNSIGFLGKRKHATKRHDLCMELMKRFPNKNFFSLEENVNYKELISLYNKLVHLIKLD